MPCFWGDKRGDKGATVCRFKKSPLNLIKGVYTYGRWFEGVVMIDYFVIPELPNVQMFTCAKRRASLQVASCADMWLEANQQRIAPERLDLCKNCPLGAEHAGVKDVSLSPLRGVSVCARCQLGTTRLVKHHLCVSCYNREREFLIGKNSRGNKPVMHPQLYRLKLKILAGDSVEECKLDKAVDLTELVVAALRDVKKQVTFGFQSIAPNVRQMDLFW